LSVLSFILLFDPHREHSSVPTADCHRRRAQRWSRTALLQRRRRLVLDHREHGGRLPRSGRKSNSQSEGSLPRPRRSPREPRLYSVGPIKGPDHEAVIRFCGQGSEAAGPFSHRHCSHSRMRIAATSDHVSNCGRSAEPWLSFLVLPCCSHRRSQLDTLRYLSGRDQAPQRYQQLARQRHNHCRPACAARPLGTGAIPACQRTVFLEK
jgi:hypothetical protein